MLTPQEVSSRSFSKSVMGGYNMTTVDKFLDEVTMDYTALYKENATLKQKMKVLADSVEDYRATEDSMRAALLTAQKMASQIVKEAEEKRDAMLKEAEEQRDSMAKEAEKAAVEKKQQTEKLCRELMQKTEETARGKLSEMQGKMKAQQFMLTEAKNQMEQYIRDSKKACENHLTFLETLPTLTIPTGDGNPSEQPEADNIAEEAHDNAMNAAPQPTMHLDMDVDEPAIQEEEDDTLVKGVDENNPFLKKAMEGLDLSDLQFGGHKD